MLGTVLFVMYIDDIDDGNVSHVLQLANFTNKFDSVSTSEEITCLQDLNKMYQRSDKWQMTSNVDRGKCLHAN